MERKRFDALVAYMGSLWGRELSRLQQAGGWNLLKNMPDEAVENAIVAIAEDGREQMPPWPLVFKTAQALHREAPLALPAGDTLSDDEHAAAMIRLRAKQTPEQRRRADRMTGETRHLPMQTRLSLAHSLLAGEGGRITDGTEWDRRFDELVQRASASHAKVAV